MYVMRWLIPLQERLQKLLEPKSLGHRGEDAAARYLRRLGYVIVARGHRDNIGELDLVAVDGPHDRVAPSPRTWPAWFLDPKEQLLWVQKC